MLKIVAYHGGQFLSERGQVYLGGSISDMVEVDPECISVIDINSAIEELGYLKAGDLRYTFDDENWLSIRLLKGDGDVIEMIQRAALENRKVLRIYVEHAVDHPDFIEQNDPQPIALEDFDRSHGGVYEDQGGTDIVVHEGDDECSDHSHGGVYEDRGGTDIGVHGGDNECSEFGRDMAASCAELGDQKNRGKKSTGSGGRGSGTGSVGRGSGTGNIAEQFKFMRKYAIALLKWNPGSSVYLSKDGNHFKRFYVCPAACRQGLRHCRPIVCVDGCHLKEQYGGQLLCAIGKDGNDDM